jgi:hypothetical protein
MEFRELLVSLVFVWLAAKAADEAMERLGQTAVLGAGYRPLPRPHAPAP